MRLFLNLGGFDDGTRTKATGADLHLNGAPFPDRLYLVEVGIPDFPGLIVGMTHIVAKYRPFSADLTLFCHLKTSK
jgi:hypothetical protein